MKNMRERERESFGERILGEKFSIRIDYGRPSMIPLI